MTVPISKNKEKVIRYDKDLFERFLVVSRSREIDLQVMLSYELSPVLLSKVHLNGSMRKTAKSNLLKELMIVINIPDHLPDHDLSSTIYLIDFIVLVQSTEKGESKTFGDFAESVTSSFRFGSKIVLCPDRYDAEYSIKSFEREKRATASSRKCLIHNERTQLPPNFKEFLMNAKNKVSFISFVLNLSVEYLPSVLQSHQEVIVDRLDGSSWRISSYGKEQLPKLFYNHKEEDSRLFMYASYCSSNTTVSRIVVFSSDTELILIAFYHCSHLRASKLQ